MSELLWAPAAVFSEGIDNQSKSLSFPGMHSSVVPVYVRYSIYLISISISIFLLLFFANESLFKRYGASVYTCI